MLELLIGTNPTCFSVGQKYYKTFQTNRKMMRKDIFHRYINVSFSIIFLLKVSFYYQTRAEDWSHGTNFNS